MKFFHSLRFKLVAFSIIIEIIVLSLLIFNAHRLILSHLTTQSQKQIESIKANFQASILPLLVERDYGSLDSLLNQFTQTKNIAYIFIVKEDRIISNAKWKEQNKLPQQDTQIDPTDNIYDTYMDIIFANQSYGRVYFGLDMSFLRQAQNELLSQSFIIALIEILLSIILLFSIGYLLTKHLSTLTQLAEKISQNQFDIDININAKDELGLFAKTFNMMSQKIKKQFSTIQQQNEIKKAIFDNMSHIIIVTNENGIITSFNKPAEILLGYKASELIGKFSIELFHDKDEILKVSQELSAKFNQEIPANFTTFVYKTNQDLYNQRDWKYITKDGKTVIINLTITALKNEDGNIYGYIGVGENKTETYKLEKSLKEESHRVKTILENAGDFIHVLDNAGNLIMYSDSFLDSLGYTKEEAKTLNVRDWDKTFDPESMLQDLIDHPQIFETIHTRKDGTTFAVEIKTKGILLDNHKYLYAASRDITERLEAQKQLHQKDILLQQQSRLASMGEMIGNIAHQWRQPLSVISTLSTSYKLKQEFDLGIDSTQVFEDMEKINESAQHLSQTIDDFRNFFKSSNENTHFSVLGVIEDCEKMTAATYHNHFIELKKDIKTSHLEYYGSSSMLSQVILNVLSNAKDALNEIEKDDKIVTITVSLEKNNLIISIKDNAGGVPEEIIEKIFDPYFTTKHQSQGTGIGLYMSSQIIQKHFKGEFSVQNIKDKNGFGAQFDIKLPL